MTDTNAMDARHARSGDEESTATRHGLDTPPRPSPIRRSPASPEPAPERDAAPNGRPFLPMTVGTAGPGVSPHPAPHRQFDGYPGRPAPASRTPPPTGQWPPVQDAAVHRPPVRPSPDHLGRSGPGPDGGRAARADVDPSRSSATGPLFTVPPPLPAGPPGVAVPLDHRSPVRYTGDAPADGWRGRVYTASRGRMNPGPSAAQLARRRMINAIRRPLHEPRRVAVLSVKGGVGKTTVAACLGLVLAENRGDRIVALDANPDAGTLADRLTGVTSVTVRDLLDADPRSVTDLDRFTSLAGRLQVLASEQDPAAGEAFSRDEYERVCAVLARFTTIVVTDSGTGLVHSAMEGTLALADGLVVVGSPTIDGADRAAKTLDWLAAHGHAEQCARALVVLSCDRWSREVDRAAIRAHFVARCRGVVEIPFDPYLSMGGRILLPTLRPATIEAFLLLGALVIDGFVPPE